MADYIHTTVAPAAAAGVSCVIGFDLHTALGVAGQIIGLVSGVLSIIWVGYQMYRQYKKDHKGD